MAEALTEEQQRLLMQSLPINDPVAVPQIAPEVRQMALPQTVPNNPLSELQRLLVPTEQTIKKPENFREGVTNVFQNALVRPLQYKLGLRESPEQRLTRARTDAQNISMYNDLVELARDQNAFNRAQTVDLSQFQGPYGDALRAAQASGDIDSLVSALGSERDRLLTDDTRETLFFSELQRQSPKAFEAAMEMRTVLNPADSIKVAQGYVQLSQAQQAIWDAKNLDEKATILRNVGGDIDKYFERILQQEIALAEAKAKAENGGLVLTPGQAKIDEAFSAIFNSFVLEGGLNTKIANISSLNQSIAALQKNDDLTGRKYLGRPENLLPAETLALQENVAAVITQGMRQIIGAAFAAEEAQQFINRSFNVILPAKVNADRIRRLRSQMEGAYANIEAAVDFYGKNGTLKGWGPGVTSLTASLDQFEKNMYQPEDYRGLNNAELVSIVSDPATSQYEIDVISSVIEKRPKR